MANLSRSKSLGRAVGAALGAVVAAAPGAAWACCHGGGGGGGASVPPSMPPVMPPMIVPSVPAAPSAVQDAVRDALRPDTPRREPSIPEMRSADPRPSIPEMRATDPAEVERMEREEAAHDEARRRQTERDIDRWEEWRDRGKEIKVVVGWANNVAGGAAIAACATGVGCIPVLIYAGGKVIEVLLVSHAEASRGTGFVERLVNGSASSADYWRRVRVNGFGTMASEAIGLAGDAVGLPGVHSGGIGSMTQDAMGESLNAGYESIRDGLHEQNERQRQEIWQRQADRATMEAYGLNTAGGFPMPAGAPYR